MNNPGNRYKKFRWLMIIIIPGIVLIFSWIVMWLWNSILPQVIHVQPVTYYQAIGILVLSKILFGGFRFFPGYRRHPEFRNHLSEKWRSMSDEEKERFREELRKRCGPS